MPSSMKALREGAKAGVLHLVPTNDWRPMLRRFGVLTALLLALMATTAIGFVVETGPSRALAFVFLALMAAMSGPYRRPRWAVAGLAVAVVVAWSSIHVAGLAGSVLLCCGVLGGIALARGDQRALSPRDLCGAVAYLMLELASQGIDGIWFAFQSMASGYSGLAGKLLLATPMWGAHAAGVHLALATACLLVCSSFATRTWMPGRAVIAALATALLPVAVIVMGVQLTGYLASPNGSLAAANPFQVQLMFVPLAALLVAWATSLQRVSTAVRNETPERVVFRAGRVVGAVVVVGLAVSSLLSARSDTASAPHPKRVLFLDHGGPLADFRGPAWDSVGFSTAGLYGTLCDLLEKSGRSNTRIQHELQKEDLAQIGTVVVIDPIHAFSESEVSLLREFVGNGGGLLVMADHTDLMGMRDPTNQLLKPHGMELRFDTAMETNRSFLGCFEFRDTGVFAAAIEPIELQLLHGASIRVRSPARPVVVGRAMFGDFGDRAKGGSQGFLGDYRFVPAFEQAGDLVVVASCEQGRGRVLAFGDTSTFQNIAIGRSSAAVLDVFRWLEGEESGHPWLSWGGLAVAVAAIVGCALSFPTTSFASLAVLLAAGLLGLCAPRVASASNARAVDEVRVGQALLLHSGNLPLWEIDQFRKHSIEGLLVCAARDHLLPVLGDLREVQDLSRCAHIVIVAPGEEFDAKTKARLDAYMNSGGNVIVSAGWEESRAIAPFLAEHGIEIQNIPLGAAPVMGLEDLRTYKGVRFVNAWPVRCTPPDACESLVAVDGLSIVVTRAVGRGRLVVIGDSWFFTDANLEGEKTANIANLELLLRVLGHPPTPAAAESNPRATSPVRMEGSK